MCGQGSAALTISGMGNVSVPIAPVSAGACVTGGLGLRRDTLRLLPCDRSGASWFPDQLRGLCLQVADELVQDRLRNRLRSLED